MPTFDTPEPISVTIELVVGHVQIVASDRADTVVEVRPSNESKQADVRAAQQTRVEYGDGNLLVKAPKALAFDFSSRSIDVFIELPTDSQVYGDASVADFRGTGQLGQCRFKTSTGHVRLDRTGSLRLDTSGGHVTVDHVGGNAEISTGTGRLHIGEVAGSAVIKNSNGDTDIGTVAGDVRVRAANGDISIDRAAAGVDAKTANGSIRIGEAVRGSIVMKTAAGDLEVGIAAGTAVWLDLNTGHGRLQNTLDDTAGPPGPSDVAAEVRAHTSYGDITVRRS